MRLDRLQIKGFRCYEDVEFKFDPSLTVITGSNDGGKTALLTAIRMLCEPRFSPPTRDDFRYLDSDGGTNCIEIEIIGVFKDSSDNSTTFRRKFNRETNSSTYEKLSFVPNDPKLREALNNFGNADQQRDLLRSYRVEPGSNAAQRKQQLDQLVEQSQKLEDWETITQPDLPEISLYSSEEAENPVNRVQAILRDAVKSALDDIKQSQGYAQVVSEIKTKAEQGIENLANIFSQFDSKEMSGLLPDLEVDITQGIRVRDIQVEQNGHRKPLTRLGTAKRRKLYLALLEWQRQVLRETQKPRILLFDEPDTHFDYAAQRKLFSTLRRISQEGNTQVVVVTHSLALIDRVKLEQVVHLNHTEELGLPKTQPTNISLETELVQLARDLGLKNHLVLNACILLVEGVSEDILVPGLFEFYRKYTLSSVGVEILLRTHDEKGRPQGNNVAAWGMCQHLLRNGRRVALLLDADVQTKNSGLWNLIENHKREYPEHLQDKINFHLIGRIEIEDMFPDEILIQALSQYIRDDELSQISIDEVNRIVAEARSDSRGISKRLNDFFKSKQTILSKPKLSLKILEVVRERGVGAIPQQFIEIFEALENYADGI